MYIYKYSSTPLEFRSWCEHWRKRPCSPCLLWHTTPRDNMYIYICICIYMQLHLQNLALGVVSGRNAHVRRVCNGMPRRVITHCAPRRITPLRSIVSRRLRGAVKESCHVCKWEMSHIWMSHIPSYASTHHIAEVKSLPKAEWMSHVTCVNGTCHVWMGYVTHNSNKCVMSHM